MKFEVECTIGEKTLKFETGEVARQANGACVASLGETVVFAAAVEGDPKNFDFLPLTVDYRENTSAAGKFPGGFFKREGRPSKKEVLTSRLIDRPIRPLFPEGYNNEISVNALVWSADKENDPDVVALNASTCAVALSGMPVEKIIAGVRVGRVDGEFVVFPAYEEVERSTLNVIVGSTPEAIAMVEAGANEESEEVMLDAIMFGFEHARKIAAAIAELCEKVGVEKREFETPEKDTESLDIVAAYKTAIGEAHFVPGKMERSAALKAVFAKIFEEHVDAEADDADERKSRLKVAFGEIAHEISREAILGGKRADGRGSDDVRDIEGRVSYLPRTHGSSLFTRGETQALCVVTLGTPLDTQRVDGLEEPREERFMLHYNFRPFCVGETWPYRGPRRREIGHGALAERALKPMMPADEEFPYTVRITSDVLESNGSSSQATICGGSMALMDAGVPVKKPVAGVAMGLVIADGKSVVLTDILGGEDHDGDMDFKVAGTPDGITALQMDIKVAGVTRDILSEGFEKARAARLHILGEMGKSIGEARPEISQYAPRLLQIKIDPEKIGLVIGPGGKTIKPLQERTKTTIEIDDDGTVYVSGLEVEGCEEAIRIIEGIVAVPEIGAVYHGKVLEVKDFGPIVEFLPCQDGLVHVSEMADEYVEDAHDLVKRGQELYVRVKAVDPTGKVKLSLRGVNQETGEATPVTEKPDGRRPQRRDGGSRGPRDRGGRDRGGNRDRGGSRDRGSRDSGRR